ncbi:MAG: hypothetical protein AAB739_02730 [Patescibacteria group bacterium]
MKSTSQTNTLGNLSITPQEIAADYFEGDTAYEQYLEVLESANNGVMPVDYAKLTVITRSSDPVEYKGRYEAMTRFLQGHYHASIQGLIALKTLGVLEGQEQTTSHFDPNLLEPFNMSSKYFELLAMLSSFEFWTGNIGLRNTTPNRTSKDLTLLTRDVADQESRGVVDEFIEKLKGEGICTPFEEKRTKRAGRVVVPVARLISLMNGMVGRKSQMDHTFPKIIERAYLSLSHGNSEAERQEAFRILQDFILAFFVIRTAHRQDHGYSGWIVSHKNKKTAQQRSALFKEIMGKGRFDHLKYSLNPEKNTSGQGYSYLTRVTFHDMQESDIECIREEFRSRIEEIIPA